MGSALARVAMLSAPTTPATAMPTITMKTISSTSDIPCSARGRWRRAWRSAMHIPRFGLGHDLPRRVVGDGAGQGDGHCGVGDGAPQAVEAEAGAGAARERDTGGRLLGLQGCARNRVRDGCGGAVAVRGRADRGRRHAHVDCAPPRNRRFLRIAHDGLRLIVEAARSEEHTSELQSLTNLVCRLLLEKKKNRKTKRSHKYTTTQ